MDSFAAFPTFAAAPDPSMSFDWQDLLVQPAEAFSSPTHSHESMSEPGDMYHPDPATYDLTVASTQVVGTFGHGPVSSPYPYDTSFGATDVASCAPLAGTSTDLVGDIEAELLALGLDMGQDLDSYGLSSLFYPSEPTSTFNHQPSTWSVQSELHFAVPPLEAFTFSAPIPNAAFQPSQYAPLEIMASPYYYSQPSPQSPATSFGAGSPYSMSSSDGSDEDSSPEEAVLPLDFSPRLPRLTERGAYKKVRAMRHNSASSSTAGSPPSSSASSPRAPTSPRTPRSPAKPRARRASSGTTSPTRARAVQVSSAALLTPVNGACPVCGYAPNNPDRTPDLQRHLLTHCAQTRWVCCGVPVADAARHGLADFTAADVRFVASLGGMPMIGGCGEVFSRKDAYQRHLRDATKGCVGDTSGFWFPRTEKETQKKQKRRRAKTVA